jgi:phosphoglycerate dehydrogenase-like enzyme
MTEANYALLNSFAEVRDHGADPEAATHEKLVEYMKGADGMLLLNGAHADEITLKAITEAGTIQTIAAAHWWPQIGDMAKAIEGSGVEVIDSSEPCNQAVAEWALGALISGVRRVDYFNRALKAGNWPEWRGATGILNGRTVGLVAIGRVGRWLLKYLAPFDVRVLVYDPYISDAEAASLGVEKVELAELMSSCDAISLHAPVLDSTRDMIGEKELALLKDGALLVNSARSHLLENEALKKELESGRISAWLDVFEDEPIGEQEEYLFKLDNVVLTPHIAGTTDDMFERCGRSAIEALRERIAS